MFYTAKVQDHIRVPPHLMKDELKTGLIKEAKAKLGGYISQDLGMVIDVLEIEEVKDGVIIPGDGASYYETVFTILVFRPEMQEVVWGKIKDIQDFGAFMTIGPLEGMIHISQSMNDFVSFSKDKVLLGKETKHSLKVGDKCKGRIIAISYKDISSPKIGITMRQKGLGKEDWTDEPEAKNNKKA